MTTFYIVIIAILLMAIFTLTFMVLNLSEKNKRLKRKLDENEAFESHLKSKLSEPCEDIKVKPRFDRPRHISTISRTVKHRVKADKDSDDGVDLVGTMLVVDALINDCDTRTNHGDCGSSYSSDSGNSDCGCSCGGD